MSKIGVDERTYALMHSRTYQECLARERDPREARRLAAYALRDWYVVTDGDPDLVARELDDPAELHRLLDDWTRR
jgi:hypothetical protein